MKASFYIVRHGTTAANAGKERLRGWAPWNLSDKGAKEAREAGYFLSTKHVTRIWHSPIRRVKQTVEGINKTVGLEPKNILEDGSIVDWNTGFMEGMYVDAMKPMLDYFQRHPDLVIPGGESYEDFWDRWKRSFKNICDYALKNPQEKLVVVTHARNLVTIQHWLKGRRIGPVSYDDVPTPGSVCEVVLDSGKITLKVLKEGQKKGGKS